MHIMCKMVLVKQWCNWYRHVCHVWWHICSNVCV